MKRLRLVMPWNLPARQQNVIATGSTTPLSSPCSHVALPLSTDASWRTGCGLAEAQFIGPMSVQRRSPAPRGIFAGRQSNRLPAPR